MSMQPRPWPEVPQLTARVARAAFPKGSLAMRVRDELGPLFADAQFAQAFGRRGRRGISPGQLALVSVLQFADNLTDRQAADAVRGRIDWKYALGLELSDPGFDHTVLTGFRGRLLEHGLERRVLDVLLGRLGELGLVGGGGRQRTDSTHVLAVVRGLNALELVAETMRAALEALAAAAPSWLAGHLDPAWLDRYGARVEGYRLPKHAAERDQLRLAVGRDGYRLLAAVTATDAPAWLADLDAVKALHAVWLQRYCRTVTSDGEEVAWRASGDRPPGGALIQTPYDPQVRYGEKRGVGWAGYKVHLTETCDGVATGRPQLITNVATTDAAVPDARLTRRVHAGLAQRGLLPAEHLVDQGYTSAHLLVSSLGDHGVVLLGPVAGDSSPQGVARTGFDHTAFAIDFDRQQVTCPQGVTTSNWTKTRDRSNLPIIIARFPTKICRACPVRDHCTTARWTGRQLCFRPRDQHAALVRARAEQATHAWRQRYATRAGIEATIHQAVATTGMRRTRYVGLPKTHLGNIFAAAAVNLIRLDAYWTGTPLGKTRTTHLARLALTLTA